MTTADPQELQDEAEWIFTHAFAKGNLSNQVNNKHNYILLALGLFLTIVYTLQFQ